MGHGVGEQNQPFKKLQIPGGRGAPKYPLERIFGQGGGGGGVVEKTFHGGYGHFLELHNVIPTLMIRHAVKDFL